MRVHHLNTGTMCPIGRRLVNGTGSIFQRARMVCHCLLIETDDGLALVDTGIGLDDIKRPMRLGRIVIEDVVTTGAASLRAAEQVKALGAVVLRIVAVIDRGEGAVQRLASAGFDAEALFTKADLGV